MKNLTDKVEVLFADENDNKQSIVLTVSELLDKTSDDLYDMLFELDSCNSSGCYNENQNFCDCGSIYDDYTITGIKFL